MEDVRQTLTMVMWVIVLLVILVVGALRSGLSLDSLPIDLSGGGSGGLIGGGPPPPPDGQPPLNRPENLQPVVIEEVVYADTIRVRIIEPDDSVTSRAGWLDGDDGEIVQIRLADVDAPRSDHPNEAVSCFGLQAEAFVRRALPAGTTVWLERTGSIGLGGDEDVFGLPARYVWGANDTVLQSALLFGGYARPGGTEGQYADYFAAQASRAQEQQLGLWAACSTAAPSEEPST